MSPFIHVLTDSLIFNFSFKQTFKEKIFPLQNNIEQVNSLANLITNCNVPLSNLNLNHLEELNTRWKLLKLSIEERQKALERSAPSSSTSMAAATSTVNDYQNQQMLNLATVPPWERLVVPDTKVPYYIK